MFLFGYLFIVLNSGLLLAAAELLLVVYRVLFAKVIGRYDLE